MNESPQISVIIPVYNAEKYLAECLDSIQNQTFKLFEVLIINDGSNDSTLKIITSYTNRDDRFKCKSIENSGPSNARNIGIDSSNGKYIMFVDSDDWLHKKTLEQSFDFAESNNLEIVFFSWNKVMKDTIFRDTTLELNSSLIQENDLFNLRTRCIGFTDEKTMDPTKTDLYNTPWAKLYTSSLIKDNDIKYVERKKVGMEDVLFNIEVFQKTKRIGYLNEYMYYYRLDNPNSLTKIDTANLFLKFENLFEAITRMNLNEKQQKALNHRISFTTINVLLSTTSSSNGLSRSEQIKSINLLLSNKKIKTALKKLSLKPLKIHWKLFFFLVKFKQATLLYLIMIVIRKIK
jgi:glycosyltransferase EpsH